MLFLLLNIVVHNGQLDVLRRFPRLECHQTCAQHLEVGRTAGSRSIGLECIGHCYRGVQGFRQLNRCTRGRRAFVPSRRYLGKGHLRRTVIDGIDHFRIATEADVHTAGLGIRQCNFELLGAFRRGVLANREVDLLRRNTGREGQRATSSMRRVVLAVRRDVGKLVVNADCRVRHRRRQRHYQVRAITVLWAIGGSFGKLHNVGVGGRLDMQYRRCTLERRCHPDPGSRANDGEHHCIVLGPARTRDDFLNDSAQIRRPLLGASFTLRCPHLRRPLDLSLGR